MSRLHLIRSLCVLAVTAGYWLLMFCGTHAAGSAGPGVGNLDKLAHSGAFAGLAFLLSASLACIWQPRLTHYVGAVGLAAAYGIFDELTQMLVQDRTADPLDWLADVCGAAAGAIAFATAAALYGQWKNRHGATG